jgi:hypothetical protein
MFQSLILANLICLGGLVPVCSGNVCWCQRPEEITPEEEKPQETLIAKVEEQVGYEYEN